MKAFFLSLALLLTSGTGSAFAQISIPPGTVIPVALHGSLSTTKSKAGQMVKARVMQEIPLSDGRKVHAGAYVEGKVISVMPASNGSPARISFEFDRLVTSKGSVRLTTSLRALASTLEINDAQLSVYGGDRGTPSSAYQTTLVGGEVVYRGGGHVMDGNMIVGEPVYDGVLGSVRANLDGNCRGAIDDNNRVQALWLFSSDACGVYGYKHVKIEHAGRTNPIGEITLNSEHGNFNIRGGSGMLLRVNNPSAADGT